MSNGKEIEINLDELKAEIAALGEDAIKEQLLGIKVRQKVQQKKQQDKGSQKAYQAKQREKIRLLKEAAVRLGIYDKIDEEANVRAEASLKKEREEEAAEATAKDA